MECQPTLAADLIYGSINEVFLRLKNPKERGALNNLATRTYFVVMSSSWNFPARAEPIQSELGHFNFRAETELTKLTLCMLKITNCLQISQFGSCIMISINFMIIHLNS